MPRSFAPRSLVCAALAGGVLASLPISRVAAQISPRPAQEDARIHDLVAAASAARIEQDIRTLVGFGTRHTMSDTVSATRGIGAARRWIFAGVFSAISADCGNCLEVRYISDIVKGDPNGRIKKDVNVVNVVAILRGKTEPNRFIVHTGDIDSRVSDVINATADSPGANDNASGMAAVLEAARVLSKHQPQCVGGVRGRCRAKSRGCSAARWWLGVAKPGGVAHRCRDQQRHGRQHRRHRWGVREHQGARVRARAAGQHDAGGAAPHSHQRR
ncbi:MAG: M28 family peptidase [Gemmatimonadaceae bacterium]|nr:M28 family peptidase [Gemmatimonadaceae bacterium]